jgi:acetyl-CoA synthetase
VPVEGGAVRDLTYAHVRDETNRFTRALAALGVGPGDRVVALAGRMPELDIAALGTLKNRSIFAPLFSAFGPEPIRARIEIARPKVLVTTEALYRRTIEPLRASLPSLEHVLLVGEPSSVAKLPGVRHLRSLMDPAYNRFVIGRTDPETPALLHFTSGTTGKPKGAVHVHEAVVAHHATATVEDARGMLWSALRGSPKSPKHLEDAALPQPPAIIAAARRLVSRRG